VPGLDIARAFRPGNRPAAAEDLLDRLDADNKGGIPKREITESF